MSVLWTRLERIGKEELDRAPDTKIVATPCTGLDHIDLEECRRRGIKVLSLRDTDVLPQITATAEHTVGLILALVRKIPQAIRDVRIGRWDRERFMGRQLSSMTFCIVGMGRIGTMVHNRLRAFEMWPAELSKADIVSVHVDLNGLTSGMCDSAFFAAMKQGSYFINTSRGQVVDEDALLRALSDKHLAGAALDVACGEPDISWYLVHQENLIVTPHIGGCTAESIQMAEAALRQRVDAELSAEREAQ